MGEIRLSYRIFGTFFTRNPCTIDFFYIFAETKPQNFETMKELVEKIQAEYANFAVNAEAQVTKNNKAAGTRARKAALELSKLMKEFRKISVEAAK